LGIDATDTSGIDAVMLQELMQLILQELSNASGMVAEFLKHYA
jgi:hypothetical protein